MTKIQRTSSSGSKKKSVKNDVCMSCPAPCCRDLSMTTKRPRTKTEINELKWYLHFDTVNAYIRNRRWYLLIQGRCIYLNKDNLCKIYSRRSEICRIHLPPYCEHFGQWYDVMIKTPDDLDHYLKGTRKK
jgi:Fe-S-cluster containining protein